MNRRGFLQSILVAGVAPYVITSSGVLMPIRQRIIKPAYHYVRASYREWTDETILVEGSLDGRTWVVLPQDFVVRDGTLFKPPQCGVLALSGFPLSFQAAAA